MWSVEGELASTRVSSPFFGSSEDPSEEKASGRIKKENRRTVYQFAPLPTNSSQKVPAENLAGMTTDPPERRGARKPARRPCMSSHDQIVRERGGREEERTWTWNKGMTRKVRSLRVRE